MLTVTSASESIAPSIRVDDPADSTVATRLSCWSDSGLVRLAGEATVELTDLVKALHNSGLEARHDDHRVGRLPGTGSLSCLSSKASSLILRTSHLSAS
jgi:hypothetical protein